MIPFYIFYSMFGFQRIHDLAWAAGDSRARGFLLGATSGRTTLNGEGLQHQDGHSHILASTIPNCRSYDPAFSYEISTIIQEGIKDMYVQGNDRFYYLTLMNENYQHPKRPKNATSKNIINGAYKFLEAKNPSIRILASGVTLNFAIQAEKLLSKMNVIAEIWSITSFNELYKGAIESDRNNRLEINNSPSHVEECFSNEMTTIAVSEYIRSYPNQIRQWVKGDYIVLGTDGFGRSDTRNKLRDHFEINANHITLNALYSLGMKKEAREFIKSNKIKLDEIAPWLK